MSDEISNNWLLAVQTPEDKKYMPPLFSFVIKMFVEIFGESMMKAEPCILFNDASAKYPMLIRNTIPIKIRTSVESLNLWNQYIYHLSHEMCHYVIRQYKDDKTAIIKWFEETLCEAMSLYILRLSGQRWNECALFSQNPGYGVALDTYWKNEYQNTEESVLKKCHTLHELELVEEMCETNRKGRSIERNYLFDTFCVAPSSIAEFVYYPLFMRGDIQIDFDAWEQRYENSSLVPHLKAIQPELTA